MDQSTDMEMLVTGIKVRPARTPDPRRPTAGRDANHVSFGEKKTRDATREIFFRSSARADRATRVATDRRFVSLAARRSW